MMTKQKKPTREDIEWMRDMVSMLKEDGGLWVTDYAMYRRYGNTIVCTKAITEVAPHNMINPLSVEKLVAKDKRTIEAIGMKFKDRRKTINN